MPSITDPAGRTLIFCVVALVAIVLGFAESLFFHFVRDAKVKNKVHALFAVGSGAGFFLFAGWAFAWMPPIFIFVLPIVCFVTYLHLRTPKFCESCGRPLYRGKPSMDVVHSCPHCGAAVVQKFGSSMKKEPNQPPEPTAPSGRGSS
ncbi:MAG: hypothetical protein PSW75_09900 [bacterium]|nr:hypothetical protein [bacterium]MDI1336905.1 hypothetical protein [Lacunisphaera sp.]